MTTTAPPAAGTDAVVRTGVSNERAYRRILRRETHSSRSGAAIVVLVALIVVSAWVGIEAVYAGLGLHAILFSPLDVISTLRSARTSQGGLVLAVGIVTGLVGIVVIVVGLSAGRRGRHTVDDPRVAVVIDDQVIAATLARRARIAGGLASGQVNAWVSRSAARISITPASGTSADDGAVLDAARDELVETAYTPRITPHVRITDSGRLGA